MEIPSSGLLAGGFYRWPSSHVRQRVVVPCQAAITDRTHSGRWPRYKRGGSVDASCGEEVVGLDMRENGLNPCFTRELANGTQDLAPKLKLLCLYSSDVGGIFFWGLACGSLTQV